MIRTMQELQDLEADEEIVAMQADQLKAIRSGPRLDLVGRAADREKPLRKELESIRRRKKELREVPIPA